MCWNRQQFLITIGLVLGLNSIAKAAVDDMDEFYSMSPGELAELSVSIATGTEKPVFQSAGVTSVVTAEQIKTMGATELHEVLETIPGLHVSIQANTYDYIYTMRGIRNGTNSQVLVLLDGNRFSLPYQGRSMIGLELPVENIQQVEVIRGPGSAMYGADAFAGVINIITKKAKDIEGTTIGGRIGNWDTQSTWAQHGSHWAGWDVAASLQYHHTNGDDQRIINADSQSQIDSNPLIRTNVSNAPGAMQTQFESWNAHLNLQRKHWDIGFWAFNAESGARAGAAAALDLQGIGNAEQYMGSIRFSTEDWFEDWEFLAHASYLYSDFQTNQLQAFPNNTLLPIGKDGNINFKCLTPTDKKCLTLFTQGVKDKQGRTQQVPSFEFSGIYKGLKDHLLRFQTGYRYEEIKTREIKNFGPGVLSGNPPAIVYGAMTDVTGSRYVYLPDTSRSIWSLAIQDEWQLAQDWQLTAGVRFDHYSDFGATVNPRVALVWDINEQLTSKLLYGRAFRAPNFSEQGNANNPVLLGNSDLDPEIINTIELAFDYRPFQSLRTGVNLYYYSIEDAIEAVPIRDKPNERSRRFMTKNVGDLEGYGLEFEWNWQLHEQFFISGNYAWQHAHDKDTDFDVAGVPEQQLYVAALWEFMPRWSLQSQLKWIGERRNMLGDKRKNLEDYETVDITLRGQKIFGHLNLAASVRNIFNKHAREPAVPELPDQIPTLGRSFYFEASVYF